MTTRMIQTMESVSSVAETNHRVSNNLALLASLIQSEARAIADPQASSVLEMTRRRLFAIANVHRRLHRSEHQDTVDLKLYLEELCGDLQGVCEDEEGRRRLVVRADSVHLAADQAAEFGILVAELVGNACKHAYPRHQVGEIRVILSQCDGGGWQLAVEDDGTGMPGDASHLGLGLGMRIVSSAARRLGSRYGWSHLAPGTRFTLWADSRPASETLLRG